MPAYFVYLCTEVIDRRELGIYWEKIVPTLAGTGAKSISSYMPFVQLEGDKVEGVAVVEFPSMEAGMAWYNSPAYQAICHHRTNGARYIGLLVEGGTMPAAERMLGT